MGKNVSIRVAAVGVATLGALISGCTSMLTHLRYDDNQVINNAKAMALTMTCADKEMIEADVAYPFALAFTDLLSVAVYDQALYERTYRDSMADWARYSPSSYAGHCAEAKRQVVAGTPVLRARYQELSATRRQEALGLGQGLAGLGTSGYSGYSYARMPSGQVTFGQKSNVGGTQHFLVNTGAGQRQCLVTTSGYVNCM